jgi:hypothetical protein
MRVTRQVPPSISRHFDELRTWADAIVIFSAMAVESFVNYYGVTRLGGDWYQSHLERVTMSRKLRAVLKLCRDKTITDDSEILHVVRRLFERRNELVHPKTYDEITSATAPPVIPAMIRARESVADMTRFFELHAEYDPDTRTCDWI